MPKPTDFETLSPASLATVAGGRSASSSGTLDASLATALTGIVESLAALKSQQSSGPDLGAMMTMMAMMGGPGGSAAPAPAAAPQPKAWNYDQATGTWTSTY